MTMSISGHFGSLSRNSNISRTECEVDTEAGHNSLDRNDYH